MEMIDEAAHATFGASSSHRWLNCPGSIKLSEHAPPGKESEYALEGTRAHECLDYLLKHAGSYGAAYSFVVERYGLEMVEHVLTAFDWVMERLNRFSPDDVVLHTETRVDASPFTCEGQFGTVDVALAAEFGKLTVIDFKYGAGIPVDVVDESGNLNTQLEAWNRKPPL